MTKTWTIKDVLDWTAGDFSERGIDSPRLEAEALISGLLGKERLYLYTNFDRPLSADELTTIKQAVGRRRNGESAATIIGKKEFWSLTFTVNADVLIPRPDTETLVQAFLDHGNKGGNVLDLCTGSGCIAVTLADECPDLLVTATDKSTAALAVATENVETHNMSERVTLHEGDLFDAIPAGATFDAIVTNPPYVIGAEIHTLAPEVKAEPRMALEGGGDDGLDLIRRILSGATDHLAPDGQLYIEMDPRQTHTVANELGPELIGIKGTILKDLSGTDRVVWFQRNR